MEIIQHVHYYICYMLQLQIIAFSPTGTVLILSVRRQTLSIHATSKNCCRLKLPRNKVTMKGRYDTCVGGR